MPRYRASSRLYNAAGAPYVRWYRRISYGLAASKVSASKYKLPRRATTLDVPPQRRDNIFVHIARPPFSLPLSVPQPFCPGSRPRRSAGGFPAIGYLSSRHHLPSINPRGRRYPTASPLSLLSIFLPSSPNPSSQFALPLPKLHYSIFIPIIAVIGINVNGGKYLIIPLVYTTRHLAMRKH